MELSSSSSIPQDFAKWDRRAQSSKMLYWMRGRYGVRVYGQQPGRHEFRPGYIGLCQFYFSRCVPGGIHTGPSGGVAELLNLNLRKMGSGFRMYASHGNATDVNTNELLIIWQRSGNPTIIMHIESMKDTPDSSSVADALPVINPSWPSGQAAPRLPPKRSVLIPARSCSRILLRRHFEHAGIMRFQHDRGNDPAAYAFATQPVPAGPNVGIIANAVAPASCCVDECVGRGLALAKLTDETKKKLRAA